ncbi:MAG: exopolysaccharide biosynthesis polyprenyl glycosylphosphotransferase [Solirubrobacteraceae bacterium]
MSPAFVFEDDAPPALAVSCSSGSRLRAPKRLLRRRRRRRAALSPRPRKERLGCTTLSTGGGASPGLGAPDRREPTASASRSPTWRQPGRARGGARRAELRRQPASRDALALPLVVLAGKIQRVYERDELVLSKSTIDEAPKLFQLATFYALLVYVFDDQLLSGTLGSAQMLVLWIALFLFAVIGRWIARVLVRRALGPERCLFVGSDESYARLLDKLSGDDPRAELVARMSLSPTADPQLIAAASAQLHRLVADLEVHRVVIEPSQDSPQHVLDFVREAKATGVPVSLLPRILDVVGSAIEVHHLDGVTLLGVRQFGLSRSSALLKRTFDLLAANVGLVVLAPLFAVIAIAIKLDSRGPVFFRQPRVRRDGEHFDIWKFRSMVSGAHGQKTGLRARNEAGAGLFKIADDPRVTRVGRALRRHSLDELPQLINVLRGEMSLVGPRPLVADEDEQILGMDRRRLQLTPGMTGHWQILGSSRVPLAEMVKLDYLYVAGPGWSLWSDVKILLRTLAYMLARRGM